ncbi:cobalamin biosynthesis protein CobD [Sulfobacillus acidophilus TPY]|uniref:Cobalamin biosynthesis protein CobD n=1 Tax=Sulfobacillus acidophilus (strain ATCC 700253 / DSM 10332 / NAL) TaxID=679936 RepID=G8TU02_SULAD|nr:cobalamin biosynthesis protein CobD [Sulfobacillus acidophilus TPY]AEW04593.1 Cobalamin biosynthesis protein cbiB [Sulfobacillus acidophilus DSM 10332]
MLIGPLWTVWSGYDLAAWILLGAVVDLLLGDPTWRFHPVRLIGRMIHDLERLIRKIPLNRIGLRIAGTLLTLLVVTVVLAVISGMLWEALKISVWLFRALVVGWTYLGLAIRGLTDAALVVYRPLVTKQWDTARQWLSYIVGRDTDRLNEQEMVRATVETVAENTCDAIIAPLFYAFLGGPAWLWAYKAINTLDSMIGYRNARYEDFGWFAARLDDWANWIPARISGLAIAVAASLDGRFHQAYHMMRRDGRRHPSPNSGLSEAAMAGALGVALGGPNTYGGVVSLRPKIGEEERPLHPVAILQAISVSWRATLVTALIFGFLAVMVSGQWL